MRCRSVYGELYLGLKKLSLYGTRKSKSKYDYVRK